MGLLDSLMGGMSMKDPVDGTAQIVSCTAHRGRGVMQNCRMQLVVEAEGIEATAVEHSEIVHNQKWPHPGMVVPAKIDRANPKKVKLDWDAVQGSRERAQDSAEAIAAAKRGEGGPAANLGGAQVINLSGGDLSQLSDEQRQKLAALGVDPAALAAAGGGGGGGDAADDDDRLDQLQKLADLKERGALTEKEFEAEKKKLLGG
jgi:Short C-terminal domain